MFHLISNYVHFYTIYLLTFTKKYDILYILLKELSDRDESGGGWGNPESDIRSFPEAWVLGGMLKGPPL